MGHATHDVATLIDGEQWDELADVALELAGDPARADEAEHVVLACISSGRVKGLAAALRRRDDLPLLLQLYVMDAAVRVHDTEFGLLQQLIDRLARDGAPSSYRAWSSALSAEFYLWQGELTGLLMAQLALAEITDDGSALTAMARGRLRRIMVLSGVLAGGDAAEAAQGLLHEALDDFASAGVEEEAAATRMLTASIVAFSTSGEAQRDQFPIIRECVDQAVRLRSDRVALGWLGLGWSATLAFDLDLARMCRDRLDEAPADAIWPVLQGTVDLFRSLIELHDIGPAPALIERIGSAFRDLNEGFVTFPSAIVFVSSVLLDYGAVDTAELLMAGGNTADMAITFATRMYVREVNARIAVSRSHGDGDIAELDAIIDEWEASGNALHAAELALRGARDLERAGLVDRAERMRAGGLEKLPAPDERNAWQRFLTQPLDLIVRPRATRELLLCTPDVQVVIDGNRIDPTGVPARILLLLAIRRSPTSAEWLVEALWPDTDPAATRNRLKVHLHRLRQIVGLASNEFVVRDGVGLALVPGDDWRIDLWEFDDLCRGSTAERLLAIETFGVDICGRQFAYDELVDLERARVRSQWVTTARDLLDTGAISPQRLVARMSDASVDDGSLAQVLEARLREQGDTHAAELAHRLQQVD